MRELVALRHASLRAFLKEIDHIVAVCNWSKRVLIANDIPDRKISVSRHALTQPWTESEPSAQHETTPSAPLRLAYIGRLDPIKGVDTVIRAVRSLIDVDIELHIHGVVQNESGRAYHEDLRSMSMGDPRIVWERTMQSNEVVSVLRRYDVLVVPSRALETGPLVVLEAFAAGIPVIGSNLGGIAELVEHDVNGLLVPPSSVKAWGDELRRLVTDPELLARLTAGVRPPRRMEDVATEMVNIYQTLILRDRIDQRDVISL
jgi:glycosyltransferase involved in cell wall biosynthesis